MSYIDSQQNAQENFNRLISKCWEDENFKKELIANPKETMEAFYGRPLDTKGKDVTIVVNDQSDANYVHFNIPPKPDFSDMELTDAELEAVAGGRTVIIGFTLICWSD